MKHLEHQLFFVANLPPPSTYLNIGSNKYSGSSKVSGSCKSWECKGTPPNATPPGNKALSTVC